MDETLERVKIRIGYELKELYGKDFTTTTLLTKENVKELLFHTIKNETTEEDVYQTELLKLFYVFIPKNEKKSLEQFLESDEKNSLQDHIFKIKPSSNYPLSPRSQMVMNNESIIEEKNSSALTSINQDESIQNTKQKEMDSPKEVYDNELCQDKTEVSYGEFIENYDTLLKTKISGSRIGRNVIKQVPGQHGLKKSRENVALNNFSKNVSENSQNTSPTTWSSPQKQKEGSVIKTHFLNNNSTGKTSNTPNLESSSPQTIVSQKSAFNTYLNSSLTTPSPPSIPTLSQPTSSLNNSSSPSTNSLSFKTGRVSPKKNSVKNNELITSTLTPVPHINNSHTLTIDPNSTKRRKSGFLISLTRGGKDSKDLPSPPSPKSISPRNISPTHSPPARRRPLSPLTNPRAMSPSPDIPISSPIQTISNTVPISSYVSPIIEKTSRTISKTNSSDSSSIERNSIIHSWSSSDYQKLSIDNREFESISEENLISIDDSTSQSSDIPTSRRISSSFSSVSTPFKDNQLHSLISPPFPLNSQGTKTASQSMISGHYRNLNEKPIKHLTRSPHFHTKSSEQSREKIDIKPNNEPLKPNITPCRSFDEIQISVKSSEREQNERNSNVNFKNVSEYYYYLKEKEREFQEKEKSLIKQVSELEYTNLCLKKYISKLTGIPLLRILEFESMPREKIIRAQRIIQSWIIRKKFYLLIHRALQDQANRAIKDRNHAMNEILDTEKVYLSSLLECQTNYLDPILKQNFRLPKEVEELFGEFKVVTKLSNTLLAELQTAFSKWPCAFLVGEVFIKMAPVLSLYFGYIKIYNLARESLFKFKATNGSFSQTIDRLTVKNCSEGKLDLISYLIMPIQRLPRYRLLLKALIDKTSPEHKELPTLNRALEKICGVMDDIERKSTTIAHIQSVAHSPPPRSLSPPPIASSPNGTTLKQNTNTGTISPQPNISPLTQTLHEQSKVSLS